MDELKPIPTNITLHQKSKSLELHYSDTESYQLSCEYLRVLSPSAEVRGHGPGEETLQVGKLNINITAINPVGKYAVQFTFTDDHKSGIYSWEYLYELCLNQEQYWNNYLQKLQLANAHRDPDVTVVKLWGSSGKNK